MKIAIDISQIIYEGTGVATYTRELVRTLLEIDRKNRYLLFGVSLRKRNLLEEFAAPLKNKYGNVETRFIPLTQSIANILWNSWHRIPIEVFTGNISILHTSDWIEPPAHALKITTVHDVIPLKFPHYTHQVIRRTHLKRLYWVKKESNKIIADSQATADDLAELLGIKKSKIEVIYPGADKSIKQPGFGHIGNIKSKYSINNDFFLAVGTNEPRKNLYNLISAFNKFQKKTNSNMNLVIAGNSGWGGEVEVNDRIKVLGYVSDSGLQSLYAKAAAFVYPSLYEGFGLPVLEAMSLKCPVITSDRGSLREIAGEAAYLVNPESIDSIANALKQLTGDKILRDKLIVKGTTQAAKFKWSVTAKNVLDLYEKVIKENL
jgi:glycosyltransferase involved in cell wall biosynthesis